MQRLPSMDPQVAQGRRKELFDTVEQALGMIPNAAKVMANSPSVLASYLAFSTSMAELKIGEKLHNQLKLITSESNQCDYCTSILTAVAPAAGLSADDIVAGRTGNSDERRTKGALAFANDVLDSRGKVTDAQLAAVRDAGFDDQEIVEIVASVVLGCFTNFLNNVADTQLDVARAEPIDSAACSSEACVTH